jgi:hypothetical protein
VGDGVGKGLLLPHGEAEDTVSVLAGAAAGMPLAGAAAGAAAGEAVLPAGTDEELTA